MSLSKTTQYKYSQLKSIFLEMESALIAYSGGVDSSLLLKIGTDTLKKRCFGAIGSSASLGQDEFDQALQQAEEIRANLKVIKTKEFDNNLYVLNNQERCYFCKSELFEQLKKTALDLNLNFIVEGSNYDDLNDYRPGMKAAKEKKIRSPLVEAELSKNEIREISRHLGLNTWNKPSQPCLSSRVAYGIEINDGILSNINQAEIYLKSLAFNIVRVRYFGNYVSIEVGENEVSRLSYPQIKNSIIEKFKKIGFYDIRFDPEGYKSGKLNSI